MCVTLLLLSCQNIDQNSLSHTSRAQTPRLTTTLERRATLAKAATPTKMMMTMTRSPTRRSKLKIGSTPIRTLTPGTIFLKKAVASVITVLR